MAVGTVAVRFIGDTKDLVAAFDTADNKMSKFGAAAKRVAVGIGAAVVIDRVAEFGMAAVKSFAQAEQAQERLADAFEKFPKLADTNKRALEGLNTALAAKTRFDDDATASGQAVLAQFELTGQQITELTPLLQDFAAKTGTDLPTAAEQLGKALLGQGRALKSVGIDFVDTGSVAGNFDQIMAGLRTQVGGFAEKEGETAQGKLEILKNRFGELQEAIGEKLMPVLLGLSGWFLNTGIPAVEKMALGARVLKEEFSKVADRMSEDGAKIANVVNAIRQWFQDLPGNIRDAFIGVSNIMSAGSGSTGSTRPVPARRFPVSIFRRWRRAASSPAPPSR
jgi:hypothetical protein